MRENLEDEMEKRFNEREKIRAFKERSSCLRLDRRKNGIKFWDEMGSGRIVNGKKIYKGSNEHIT